MAAWAASSVSMIDSTSSMQMSTFSGFKSVERGVWIRTHEEHEWRGTSVNDAATAVHVVEAHKDLLCDLLDEVHGHALVLVALDESEQVLAEDLKHHADVRAVGSLDKKLVQEYRDRVFTRVVRQRGY